MPPVVRGHPRTTRGQPFSHRFSSAYRPFFTVFHRFPKNGWDDEPHVDPARVASWSVLDRLPTRAARECDPSRNRLGAKICHGAVGDVPKKCPCEGQRAWFSERFWWRMGTMKLLQGDPHPSPLPEGEGQGIPNFDRRVQAGTPHPGPLPRGEGECSDLHQTIFSASNTGPSTQVRL